MYEDLLKETSQNYSLDGIYEEIENFSEITSDLIEKSKNLNIINQANQYLNDTNF